MKTLYKTSLVIVGAVVCSTVAIKASDVLQTVNGELVGLAVESERVCDVGTVPVNLSGGTVCVDIFEASPASTCPVANPASPADTQTNLNDFECAATSQRDVIPWRYVSLNQAQQLCARSGKRLPTNDEWFALAQATGDQSSCVTNDSTAQVTGAHACVTQAGLHDMVGNVWEWIDGEIVDGQHNDRALPASGYVDLVDSDGVVLRTAATENEEYGEDYAMINTTGVQGIIRGGFFDSGSDAGIYAQNMAVSLDIKTPGVGFRCVKNL